MAGIIESPDLCPASSPLRSLHFGKLEESLSRHPSPLSGPLRSGSLLCVFAVASFAGPIDPSTTSPDGRVELVRELFTTTRPVVRDAAVGASVQTVASGTGFVSVDDHPDGDLPRDVAFLPDGSAVVIANRDTDMVTFFDVSTKSVTAAVPVGDFPVDVAVTPNGQYALAPCVFADAVYVIDIATKTIAAVVPVTGTQPFSVAVTADGALAVVGVINDAVASAFSVIDLTTLVEVRSIPSASQGVIGFFATPESGTSGNLFTQFDLSPDSRTIVLPDRTSSTVFLYDAIVGVQTAAIATAASPTSIDVSADGLIAVVGHEGTAQTVSVIDVPFKQLKSSFGVGVTLVNQVIRVAPSKSHALAAISNNLIFVDLTSGAVVTTISTGTVGDIELTFDGAYAFVSNFNARVIDVATRTLVKTIPFAACVDAAASPTQRRMVALNNRFREDVLLFDVNGAAGFAEAQVSSGPLNEGDAPRTLAITKDGRRVLAANNVSRNGAIIDLDGRTTTSWPAAGDRPLGVAVSPDGQTGVIANGDDDTVTIVDMQTGQSVAQLAVATRPAEVVISPDSQWAYVTTVAGTDRLHFIQLAGAASQVVSSLPTGQMGSVIATYNVLSGMALSPDGAVLVVCISFDDQLMVVDTATRTEIHRLATGDFPIRARFGPGSRCYVANAFGDSVDVFHVDLFSQLLVTNVGPIEFPLTLDADDAGSFVYIGGLDFNNPRITLLNAGGGLFLNGSVPMPSAPRATHLSPLSDTLYVACVGGELVRMSASGASSGVIDQTPLSGSPADLVFSEFRRAAVVAQPGPTDGVDVVVFADECPGTIVPYGAGCPGAGGFTPLLALDGCARDGMTLSLAVDDALGGTLGLLALGTAQAAIPMDGGCFLNVQPLLITATLAVPGAGPGGGGFAVPGTLPAGTTGYGVTLQFFQADPSTPQGFANSGGVQLLVP